VLDAARLVESIKSYSVIKTGRLYHDSAGFKPSILKAAFVIGATGHSSLFSGLCGFHPVKSAITCDRIRFFDNCRVVSRAR
jgi:hypothetical protein